MKIRNFIRIIEGEDAQQDLILSQHKEQQHMGWKHELTNAVDEIKIILKDDKILAY